MRYIQILLCTLITTSTLAALAPTQAQAKCGRPEASLSVFPEAKSALPVRPTIMLEATGELSETIENKDVLASMEFQVKSKTKSYTVAADVLSSHEGVGERHSVLLQPAEALPDGAQVTLRYTRDKKRAKVGSWTIDADLAQEHESLGKLGVADMSYRALGCGPSTSITVAFGIAASKTGIMLATVVDDKGVSQTYPMIVEAGATELRLGRSMCGGRFTFSPDRLYEITLTGYDGTGKATLIHDNALMTKGPRRK